MNDAETNEGTFTGTYHVEVEVPASPSTVTKAVVHVDVEYVKNYLYNALSEALRSAIVDSMMMLPNATSATLAEFRDQMLSNLTYTQS
jgi:hypothetical protein